MRKKGTDPRTRPELSRFNKTIRGVTTTPGVLHLLQGPFLQLLTEHPLSLHLLIQVFMSSHFDFQDVAREKVVAIPKRSFHHLGNTREEGCPDCLFFSYTISNGAKSKRAKVISLVQIILLCGRGGGDEGISWRIDLSERKEEARYKESFER